MQLMSNYFRFGTFDYLKQVVTGGEGVLSPVQRMMCGLGAGMTEAALVVTWIETLKVRLIVDQKKTKRFRGLYHAAASMLLTLSGTSRRRREST